MKAILAEMADHKGKELVKVAVLNDTVEAEMLRGLLEAQQIPVFLSKEAVGQVWGLTIGAASEVEAFVSADQAEAARQVVQEFFSGASVEED